MDLVHCSLDGLQRVHDYTSHGLHLTQDGRSVGPSAGARAGQNEIGEREELTVIGKNQVRSHRDCEPIRVADLYMEAADLQLRAKPGVLVYGLESLRKDYHAP